MGGRSEEERRFTVLLERVEHQYKALSEKVMSLDQKIDRGLQEVRHDMGIGFGDLQKGIGSLVKELRNHTHAT